MDYFERDTFSLDSCPEPQKLCLKDRTYLRGFVNKDESIPIIEDLPCGGILFTPQPAPDYAPIDKTFEKFKSIEKDCVMDVATNSLEEWQTDDLRRHNALCIGREIVYFPVINGNFSFNTRYGKYLWRVRSASAKPDVLYIHQLKKNIFSALHKFQRVSGKIHINRLMFNDSLFSLSWFPPIERNRFINTLAKCLRDQDDLTWLAAENVHLLQEAGLRLLFAISVTSGYSLEYLHLWNFFRGGQIPVIPLPERSIHDPFVKVRPDDVPVDTLIRYLWREYIMKSSHAISYQEKMIIFNTTLQCLENLTVLSVTYTFLTFGQGNSLVQLGCIKHKTLRYLNILYTVQDDPQKTQRYICASAWREACKKNPYFRVNLVAIRMADYSLLSQILTPYIPLEGFYASSGIRSENKSLWLDLTMRVLTERYKRFIHRIYLHVCRPRLMVDLTITKMLMQFPFLEEFEYRGPMDRLTTLESLCEFVLKHDLRLRKIHFYLPEDPCYQEPYRTAINEVHDRYEPKFINKHIDFELKLVKM